MAIQFLSGLNVDGNITLENSAQLKAARIDNLNSDPSGSLGRIYYNTQTNKLRLYNGGWVDIDTGTDGDTTYDLAVPGSTTKIRLSGSDGTNDDVEIAGSGLITVTRTNSAKLTISTTATANTGTVTSVSGGDGISISGSSTVSPTVNIDYAGTDNAILTATTATPAGADTLWFSDATDNTIKKALISAMPGFGADGTVTSVTAGTGLVLESGSSTVNPTIGLDYAGADNFINEASNGTGVTVASSDRVVISDITDNNVKYVTISQLTSAVGGGTVTSVQGSGGTTGLSVSGGPITSSGTLTLGGTLITSHGGTGLTSYSAGDILFYRSGTTLERLAIGAQGKVLKVDSNGFPEWADDTNTGLTSVGITETGSALTITNSPLTSNGNINIAGAGTSSQVILGNLTLATLPVDGVTSVATGSGLTGGTITGSGTVSVDYGANGLIADAPSGTGQPEADDYLLVGLDSSSNGETRSFAIVDIKLNSFGTPDGSLSIGNQKLIDVATGTSATDGVNLGQVQSLVAGVGVFQGGYNASTNTPKIAGSSNIALTTGDFFVVTTDGTISFNGSTVAVEVGDMIYANANISASSNPAATAYSIVIQDQNIAGVGATDGATEKGVAGFSSATFAATANGFITVKSGGISDAQLAETYNQIIGIDTDINTSGVEVVDQISLTDGVVQTLTKRTLPDATVGARGVAETATQTEVDNGTSGAHLMVTPATLKAHLDAQSYSGTFPSSSASTWTVGTSTHGLGSGPFVIQTFDADGCQVYIRHCKNEDGDVSFTCTNAQSANTITVVMMKVR